MTNKTIKIKFDPPTHPKYCQLMRNTIGDSQGYFTFSNVKDGNYFVTTMIVWKVGNRFCYEGGNLMQYISVFGGETKEIVLAP